MSSYRLALLALLAAPIAAGDRGALADGVGTGPGARGGGAADDPIGVDGDARGTPDAGGSSVGPPVEGVARAAEAGSEAAAATRAFSTDKGRSPDWWAYSPITRPRAPAVMGPGWPRNPIDDFILAKLEAAGLRPVAEAPRGALLRRLSYDLTGLPPSGEDLERFSADEEPAAWEHEVDRLLDSPGFGEKWGRHWLDVVRYAETNGYERDGGKPHVWRYRDYVIGSFNADKPYDRFVREQLAGDELDDRTADSIIATGYYRLGLWDDEPADREQARFDDLDDILATTSQAFLGTTMNCARCHDHKADPITQVDYYSLLAFFLDVPRYGGGESILTDITRLLRTPEENRRLDELAREKEELQRKVVDLENVVIRRMSPEDQRRSEGPERPKVIEGRLGEFIQAPEEAELRALKRRLGEVSRETTRETNMALSVGRCDRSPPEANVLQRGSVHAKGEPVKPSFPSALVSASSAPTELTFQPRERSSGRRSVLADWIASPSNPMTARVIVNRLWQHHFGRGLVRTTNDFGRLGELPSHPELLDWLASELIRQRWSLKAIHRLIVTSSAYRMASWDDESGLEKDPANTLFWRFDMRRLTAEEIRDSILVLSDSLNLAMGGPSIYTDVPQEVLATASRPDAAWGRSSPGEADRRSVYIVIKRSLIEPILQAFDLADPDTSCAARFATTVPTQALTSLNGEFFNREAARFARRIRGDAGEDPERQVARAFEIALTRRATRDEVERGLSLLRAWSEEERVTKETALERFALLVLNLNELVYLD